jgi:hypothetical protein
VAGVDVTNLQTLVNSQLNPSPVASTAPTPRKPVDTTEHVVPSHEKIRWSAAAPVFMPRSTSAPKRRPFIEPSSSATSESHSIASSPPSPEPAPAAKYDPVAYYESAARMANDWYEEEEPEYFDNDRQDRTISIQGVSQFVTLADLAGVIRGGIVLNMYIRARDRTALISFADPLAAEKFIMHARRSDIYIKGKRLEVSWAHGQAYLPGYIARQMQNNGATRNIVVRFAPKGMTEKTIRDDLEHIHRLEVVNIVTIENHIFISLNGIQWAITARHCMQSRLKYKGTRIEFFEDECDQVLPVIERRIFKKQQENVKRPATISMANRFALLFKDDSGSDGVHVEQPVKRSVSDHHNVKVTA